MSHPNEWTEKASGANALATATRAAQTGRRHVVTYLSAAYSAAAVGLLTVKKGTDIVLEHYVHNAEVLALEIRGESGAAVSAELAAGGTGITGKVNLIGYTE